MEKTTQEEILEQTEQEGLVEAPEQIEEEVAEEEETVEEVIAEAPKSKVKEDDDEDDDDDDDEEEEDEQVKKEELKIPSTKSAMVSALFDRVNGLKKEDVSKRFKDLMAVIEAEDLGGETPDDAKPEGDSTAIGKKKKKIKISMPEINVKEDIDALVEGEELSEDFKSKASTIFEAAVHQKVMEIAASKVEDMEKEYQSELQEEIVSFRDELTDKVDGYLNYVVEEWMKENELALESSLRSEITEEFMGGLKDLFKEHYIEVPDEKVDIVENLFDKVEDLEGQLNDKVQENIKVKNELNEYRKDKILEEVCDDLADTQSEKMKTLVEGVSYEDDSEKFEEKVKTIKESYFPETIKKDENVEQLDSSSEVSEKSEPKMNHIMEAYSKAIARK
jgi:hypothetical protein